MWFRPQNAHGVEILSERCGLPLGPAAGPHTQLAVNILASYLTGSRFIELKTVQILDALEIEKPCIDVTDEGYNTEWSTELALDEAWQEYAKGWILLHAVEYIFAMARSDHRRSFIFNMSVGYDLKGILSEPMTRYIARMKDSSGEERFHTWVEAVRSRLPVMLRGTELEERAKGLSSLEISPHICRSVTLSTMHGCPPAEIEAICTHMLTEEGLDTYVKLNPTLLGYEKVNEILGKLGYGYVQLDRDGFDRDLQYPDAIDILTRLRETATKRGRQFGVKLTNTLAARNTAERLPGDDFYLSGRALYPLSLTLAARLSEHFSGDLPISFSGGISAHNVEALFQTGIRPLTLATELLKPGGYLRTRQIAEKVDTLLSDDAGAADRKNIDVPALQALAAGIFSDPALHKSFRGDDSVESPGKLPLFDCYEAPCVTACAIHQHIPGYIRLVGEGRYEEALQLIYERNALPSITGHICDHQCQSVCTRLDYEGCINIREIKRLAVLNGMEGYRAGWHAPGRKRNERVAVVGAGPAGLSAAYFLAREHFPVTLFERQPDAGGVVRYVVPHFRIPREAIESDIAFIGDHGVAFRFGADEEDVTVERLRVDGFSFILYAVGTYRSRPLRLDGDNRHVYAAFPFLIQFNRDPSQLSLGKRVAVIGAGDTAMDCARSALRSPGVEEVSIVYRRASEQMPATREEYDLTRNDGIRFRWLRNPRRFDADGTLTVEVMTLGEKDASGRRRPVPTGETETIAADSVISAIGDDPDTAMLERLGLAAKEGRIPAGETGETELEDVYLIGDGRTGPSTIVQCIAEGRKASDAICLRVDSEWNREEKIPPMDADRRYADILEKRGDIVAKPDASTSGDATAFGARELSRCLECDFVCNKCVDVCPNRANIAVSVEKDPLFSNPFEIVHIDAYCNECGNCGHFCPWREGVPYVDKPTVFSTYEDFTDSVNPGWFIEGETVHVRYDGTVSETTRAEARRRSETVPVAAAEAAAAGFRGTASTAYTSRDEARFYRLLSLMMTRRPHLFGNVDPPVQGVPR